MVDCLVSEWYDVDMEYVKLFMLMLVGIILWGVMGCPDLES